MTENNDSRTDKPVGAQQPRPATTMPDDTPAWALAERIAWRLLEKSAADVVVLDLRGRSDVCDFFVIATGHSDTQVRALARWVKDSQLEAGHRTRGLEGLDDGGWALLDYFDVVVHVFHERTREYFQLERLWGDAGRLDLAPDWFAANGAAERHPDLNFATARGPGGSERG